MVLMTFYAKMENVYIGLKHVTISKIVLTGVMKHIFMVIVIAKMHLTATAKIMKVIVKGFIIVITKRTKSRFLMKN